MTYAHFVIEHDSFNKLVVSIVRYSVETLAMHIFCIVRLWVCFIVHESKVSNHDYYLGRVHEQFFGSNDPFLKVFTLFNVYPAVHNM